MAFLLPVFENSSCRILTVCGRIKDDEHPVSGLLPEGEPMVATYQAAGRKVYLRLLSGGKKHTHLHVDLAAQEFFGKDRAPKTNTTKTKLLRILDEAESMTLDCGVCGGFVVPLDGLPEQGLIRSLSAEQKTGGLAVRLTSGECKIDGAPVRRLYWNINEGEKTVFIRVEGSREDKVDDRYLVRTFDWIGEQFNLFVLGKVPNGNG